VPVLLEPFALPGGLGAHKWRDRRLLDALGDLVPGAVPLLVDTDGLVLEAGYANVWIVEGDALITPPADGRILPGTTRAALLDAEDGAREEPIDVVRLASAESVFLTSSISGRLPARLRGAAPAWAVGSETASVPAAALL
jgi:para-aminobenzoate synthetase/4-amino-4-deoxychorismate lyase